MPPMFSRPIFGSRPSPIPDTRLIIVDLWESERFDFKSNNEKRRQTLKS